MHSYKVKEITYYQNHLHPASRQLVSPEQSTMSGDAAGLIENKASGLDPWPVLLAEISTFLVFATTSKAKMMKVRLFDIFLIS